MGQKRKTDKPEFLRKAIQISWEQKIIPHCVLDISRRCNITCRACYNIPNARFKSLKTLKDELEIIQRHQKITSVLIVGGEPLLHPKIYEIIKMVRKKGLFAEMSTNGVLFNETVAEKLAQSGLNMCSFHIESKQKRPDLSFKSTEEERNSLREEKAHICEKYGMDSGIMLTAFKDNPEEIKECTHLFLRSKYLKYFVITSYIDSERLGKLSGNLGTKIVAQSGSSRCSENSYTMKELVHIIGKNFDNQPFNYIASTKENTDARWLNYRCVSAIDSSSVTNFIIHPSLFERGLLKFHEIILKKSIWYLPQSSFGTKIYLTLNGLLGHYKNFIFLAKNIRKCLILKTLIATTEVEIKNSEVILCASCVDAQVKSGKLVPTCLADNIESV